MFDINVNLEETQSSTAFTPRPLPDTGFYDAIIKEAILDKSKNGANCVKLTMELHGESLDKPMEYNETIYFTNRKGEIFFTNREGKKVRLPGFDVFDHLLVAACGQDFVKVQADPAGNTEEKLVEVYEHGQKVSKKVMTLSCIRDAQVRLFIQKALVNKQEPNELGDYVPTNESREECSTIRVLFQGDKTMEEHLGDKEAAWAEKNKKHVGVTKDKMKQVAGTVSNRPVGSKPALTAAPVAKKSFL